MAWPDSLAAGLRLERVPLDDVADRDVVEPFEHDAALEAGADLANVVLHPAKRRDEAVEHALAPAQRAGTCASLHDAVDDHAAGDRRLTGAEQLPHLGVAEDGLDHLRLEHARERLLDVVEQLVDDLVEAHFDAARLGRAPASDVDAVVESDDDPAGRRGEVD